MNREAYNTFNGLIIAVCVVLFFCWLFNVGEHP